MELKIQNRKMTTAAIPKSDTKLISITASSDLCREKVDQKTFSEES
jgi:hypothetical protein